ncbi:hypothetical protein N0V82_004057 [Gnomoniopsis sp. IMI 355080]|nr:hypothetical protein N0V82_004057 [Gnomoniopsis sp. IMI 355080]
MATVQFTEEPEEVATTLSDHTVEAPGATVPRQAAAPAGALNFDVRWDEAKWCQGILRHDCIQQSRCELDSRVASFLAVATDEEKAMLSASRDDFKASTETAIKASKVGNKDDGAGPPASVAERVKGGLNAFNAVAYQYVQILDVMVGQAPEYVGIAYGAVKILLIAQISHEELKTKVKEHLEDIQLKFKIIDHLTAYMPSSQLVSLVAQAYSLFNRFIAKAIKHYTRSRHVKILMSFTMPWKRYQEIVDAIESILSKIKDVAQYIGLAEGHTTMVVSQETLVLLRNNMQESQETKALVQSLRVQLDAISIRFSKAKSVQQTADSLAQLVEERLAEPTMDAAGIPETREAEDTFESSNTTSPPYDAAAYSPTMNTPGRLDSRQDILFSELQESHEEASRMQRANDELPNMREYRAQRKSFKNSEMAITWAESRRSEILWIDGSEVLSREDFNASFAFPLMLVVESLFVSFMKVQHFCGGELRGKSDPYLVLMQDLVAQALQQQPSISSRLMPTISRNATSTTEGLWNLLSKIVSESELDCVFLIIGGIDHVANNSSQPEKTQADIIRHLQELTFDDQRVFKIIVTMSMEQPKATSPSEIFSLIRSRHGDAPRRRLSLVGLENTLSAPLMSQRLTDFQERRCRTVQFTELPMLYKLGTVIYMQDKATLSAFIVSEMSGMEPRPFGSYAPLRLRIWAIDHDGKGLCKLYQDIAIHHFPGQRSIASLSYIPSGYLPDEVKRRQEIITRGRLYWSYSQKTHYVDIDPKQASNLHPSSCIKV